MKPLHIFTLFLTLCMLLTLVASCGQTSDNPETKESEDLVPKETLELENPAKTFKYTIMRPDILRARSRMRFWSATRTEWKRQP